MQRAIKQEERTSVKGRERGCQGGRSMDIHWYILDIYCIYMPWPQRCWTLQWPQGPTGDRGSRAAATTPVPWGWHMQNSFLRTLLKSTFYFLCKQNRDDIMTSWNIHILIKIIEGKRYDVAPEIETQLFLPSLSSKRNVIFWHLGRAAALWFFKMHFIFPCMILCKLFSIF